MPANMYHIPTSSNSFTDLDLPSGGKVQVRPVQVEDLIEMGLIDQLDMLGQTVDEQHIKRVKGTKKPSDRQPKKPTKAQLAAQEEADGKKIMEMMKDKEKFRSLRVTIDRVVARSIVQPPVSLAYVEDAESKFHPHDAAMQSARPDGFWTDMIDFADKMHVFSHVLPSGESMHSFREGSAEAVGDLDDQPAYEGPTE